MFFSLIFFFVYWFVFKYFVVTNIKEVGFTSVIQETYYTAMVLEVHISAEQHEVHCAKKVPFATYNLLYSSARLGSLS